MLNAIERYIKQAIVDRNALVASSALVSGIHLIKNNPEIVRRWVNEVQEAVNSQNDMVQYHGVSLMYQIRQHDRLAVSKVIDRCRCLVSPRRTEVSPPGACSPQRYSSLRSCRRPTCARTWRRACSSATLLACSATT
jgi:hypothetical protein